jgi:hypothetical protein
MKVRFLTLAMVLAMGLVCGSAQAQFERDAVVVLHDEAGADGKLSIFDADLTTSLVSQDTIMEPTTDFDGTGKILVQSDDDIVTVGNFENDVLNATFSLRDSTRANLGCKFSAQSPCPDGLGARITLLVGFADDRVYFGRERNDDFGGVSSSVIRNANLSAEVSGPAGFGDQIEGVGIPAAVVSSEGHLYLTYQATLNPCDPDLPSSCPGSHGRIRRVPGGDLADTVGPDQGLGQGSPVFGVHLDVLSDNTLVLARDDRLIELRDPDSVGPLDPNVSAGPFGSVTIAAIGVLSDDRVVVATDEGELHLLNGSDLTPASLDSTQALFGDPLGTHEITAMAVASDDDVVVGTAGGELLRFAYDAGAGTLTQQGTELTDLGPIADIDFLNGPPPSGACILPGGAGGGVCQIVSEAECLDQGGTYDGDDSGCPMIFNIPGDCNQDGALDLSDVICLLGHLFQGNPEFLPCTTEAANRALLDCNDDDSIDLSDAVYKLGFLFSGGPPPAQGQGCSAIEGCPQNTGCP